MALPKAKPQSVFAQESSLDFSAVEVCQSAVEGRGVYAARDLKAGEYVCPLTGILIPSAVAESPDYQNMALQIDDGWWLEEAGHPDDFINHSCNPNLAFTPDGLGFKAIKDIQRGDEIFFDYATSLYDGGWRVDCLCGSPQCRKAITGFADLSPQDQKRLLPLTLPYIRKKYA